RWSDLWAPRGFGKPLEGKILEGDASVCEPRATTCRSAADKDDVRAHGLGHHELRADVGIHRSTWVVARNYPVVFDDAEAAYPSNGVYDLLLSLDVRAYPDPSRRRSRWRKLREYVKAVHTRDGDIGVAVGPNKTRHLHHRVRLVRREPHETGARKSD